MNLLRTTLLLLGAAAPAYAAPQFTTVQEPDHGGSSTHSWTFVINDSKGECRVESCEDGIKAWLNGEAVPADRIQDHGDRIVILDQNHEVAREIDVPGHGRGAQNIWQVLQLGENGAPLLEYRQLGDHPTAMQWLTSGGKRPRIGVSMGALDEALAAQIGVEADQAIVLTEVEEGMPAAEAGVHRFDVVVAIDGQSPVTDASLREAVSAKKDGESITLSIVRRGEKLEIPVKVREIEDGTTLWNTPQLEGAMQLDPNSWRGLLGGDAGHREAMEKAMAELRAAQERMQEQLRGQIHDGDYQIAMTEAMKRLEEAQQSLRNSLGQNLGRFRLHGGGDDVYLFSTPGQQPGAPPAVGVVPAPRGDLDARIRGLEERLVRIESMLERLTDR